MTNTLKLKALIIESGLSRIEIAKKLNISLYSLQKKINNKSQFKASEIKKLLEILNIQNLEEVFFK